MIELLCVAETAAYCGVCRASITNWAKSGRITAEPNTKPPRFRRDLLDEMLANSYRRGDVEALERIRARKRVGRNR